MRLHGGRNRHVPGLLLALVAVGVSGSCPIDSYGVVTIPNGSTAIAVSAFESCVTHPGSGVEFTSVVIPNSVTTIGCHAFRYCQALTSVAIPNSVRVVGDGAF